MTACAAKLILKKPPIANFQIHIYCFYFVLTFYLLYSTYLKRTKKTTLHVGNVEMTKPKLVKLDCKVFQYILSLIT